MDNRFAQVLKEQILLFLVNIQTGVANLFTFQAINVRCSVDEFSPAGIFQY